jgi:Holliday junction resolvasome RuvABC endonuclease subunit
MRILGIDPGLQTTGFSSGTSLPRLHERCALMSLRRNLASVTTFRVSRS